MDKILGELLLKRGLITSAMLGAAIMEQSVTKERLGKVLVRNGFLRQDELLLLMREINPNSMHDEGVFETTIPASILINSRTMIVALVEGTIYLSTLSSPHVVRRLIEPFTAGQRIEFTAANPVRMQEYFLQLNESTDTSNMLSWERIFYEAMQLGSSDIHIIPRYASYTVMLRRDGILTITHEGTRDEYTALVSRVKDLSKMDMAERRRPQDGSFSMDYSGRVVNFRVSTNPTVDGESMVVRILDPDAVNKKMDSLGITHLELWRKAVSYPNGLCLICGPTGSGKTTTLAATAREMNFLERAICTVEDPVENRIPYARQVNVNPSVGLDFATAIRAFMRQDPDVIITGEIRDIETARNALKASETGHLSLGTLHTNSIRSTMTRLRDIGVQPFELLHLLRGVMVQKLMRVYCTSCQGKGCKACGRTGYRGREVISEVAAFDSEEEVQACIDGKISWMTLEQDAKAKVLAGRTSEAEFERVLGKKLSDIK